MQNANMSYWIRLESVEDSVWGQYVRAEGVACVGPQDPEAPSYTFARFECWDQAKRFIQNAFQDFDLPKYAFCVLRLKDGEYGSGHWLLHSEDHFPDLETAFRLWDKSVEEAGEYA